MAYVAIICVHVTSIVVIPIVHAGPSSWCSVLSGSHLHHYHHLGIGKRFDIITNL